MRFVIFKLPVLRNMCTYTYVTSEFFLSISLRMKMM